MKLPKIKLTLNPTITDELFYVDTDDIGFARNQINRIDNRIKSEQENKLKPWERYINNNIYSSLNKNNRMIINEKRRKIKNDSLSFNWNNQNIFNKTEIENIKASEQIKKQVKTKSQIKYKFHEPYITTSSFLETRHDTFLTNKMINILMEEKKNIKKTQDSYENSLKLENKLLDKDIEKFNDFTNKYKNKEKEDDGLYLKVVMDNKNLVELYKKQLQDYNSTVYEVYKYLKLINNLKHYAAFIHKVLGGDNDILHCDLIENMNFKDFKDYDILSITHKILKKTKNLLKNKDENLINLEDTDIVNNVYLSFKELEEKIIKKFVEKQKLLFEKNEITRLGEIEEEEKKKKYDNFYYDYNQQKQELDNKIKDFNNIYLTPEEKEMIGYYNELLADIYQTLFNCPHDTKTILMENESDIYRQIVCSIMKEIYKKEERINHLIKNIQECENENKTIFNKVLNKRKLENRALRLFQEKELIKLKDNLKVIKYNNKMRKIIIKGRYKYNYHNTPEVKKNNVKKINLTEMNINDLNLLTYH
jgi:hypothetical protein